MRLIDETNSHGALPSLQQPERKRMTIQSLVQILHKIETRKHHENECSFAPDRVYLKEGRKYDKIDIGGSGAWMVERETGEIFNIKAYGQVDKNKKIKANIGNLSTVDPENMHNRRYNYLR